MIVSRERAAWLSQEILPHEPSLRAWLRRRHVAGLETDDIVQETYAVLASLPTVAHIQAPRAYAFQTARSVILRHLRRARIVRIDNIGDLAQLDAAIDQPSPECQASDRQQLRRAIQLIEEMPAKRRQAFTLRKFDNLSQREIAQRMGISESTIEKHIGHALHTLMRAMKHGGLPAPDESRDRGNWSDEVHAGAGNQCAN